MHGRLHFVLLTVPNSIYEAYTCMNVAEVIQRMYLSVYAYAHKAPVNSYNSYFCFETISINSFCYKQLRFGRYHGK